MYDFTYHSNSARVIFGIDKSHLLAEEIQALGCSRALLLSTPEQRADVERLETVLGPLCVGIFANATMHTPVEVTEQALDYYQRVGADCVVALGGGSTIGLGKAIAYRNDAPQLVIPTTYAGSEVTPILGQTAEGIKTTLSSNKILPEVVIYDAQLTLGLPVAMSVTSALNAMAHAVEGLYAKNRNPITSLMAIDGIRALHRALPQIILQPDNLEARREAQYGAWLCGTVLGSVGMALHHKLCHTLGGSFGLPHAQTHAVMLPHTAAYNQDAAAEWLRPLGDVFGSDLGAGLYDFAKDLNAPMALRDLGLSESDLDCAMELALRNPYWNPRPLESAAIRDLLQRAWSGDRPVSGGL
ncbi:maleylacetate reductase [Pseudomonas sp. F-14 TE3623]